MNKLRRSIIAAYLGRKPLIPSTIHSLASAFAWRLLRILLLSALVAVAHAQFTYTTNNGTITITGYTGPGGAVTIPSNIRGLPVTTITDFYSGPGSGPPGAFSGNIGLTKVIIPNTVTTIGHETFAGCICLSIVTIGNGLTSIGPRAFQFCTNLASLTIPDSVTNIDYYGFADCNALTDVTIPDHVGSVGLGAFESCASLTNITIGPGVTYIGDFAFVGCPKLDVISVDPRNSDFSSVAGVLFDKEATTLITYPAGRSGSYAIVGTVSVIGTQAFVACLGLTSVTIPASVRIIGDDAFSNCTKLVALYFSKGMPQLMA